MTEQPDFATFTITYVPDARLVELKSLKLYLWSYRQEGAFHEDVTNRVLDDLVRCVEPRRMTVVSSLERARWDRDDGPRKLPIVSIMKNQSLAAAAGSADEVDLTTYGRLSGLALAPNDLDHGRPGGSALHSLGPGADARLAAEPAGRPARRAARGLRGRARPRPPRHRPRRAARQPRRGEAEVWPRAPRVRGGPAAHAAQQATFELIPE